MRFAYYIKNAKLLGDPRFVALIEELEHAGCEVYPADSADQFRPGTDALLSCGGDGTFLTAAGFAAPAGIPIAGVNFGRLGFLSECRPGDVAEALLGGAYSIESRQMLQADIRCSDRHSCALALNEVSVVRGGAAMLGVDVCVNGDSLPTYWADGLVVSTSSGSTAYSLSVGGPICTPDSKVTIIAPIAPHNLNVRPLIVPEDARVELSFRSRDAGVNFTADNNAIVLPADARIFVGPAPVKLRCIKPGHFHFFEARCSKLLWGEDVRNGEDPKLP